jgi:hypothetical protein
MFLLRSDPLVPESPFFMVEVIDSSSGVAKMCAHTNQTGSRNLLLKIGKSDYLVSLILAKVRGSTDIDEEALPQAK